MQDYNHEVLNRPTEHVEVARRRFAIVDKGSDAIEHAVRVAYPSAPLDNLEKPDNSAPTAVFAGKPVTETPIPQSPEIIAALAAVEQARAA